MKKLLLLIIAGLMIITTFKASSQKPAKPDLKQKVTIPGNVDWVNTNVKIKPKDVIIITVDGTVCFSNGDDDSCVEADGWGVKTYSDNWPGDYVQCDDPMKEYNHAAVIGNVGSDDFLVGKEVSITGKNGVLYLGINDCSLKDDFYNTGEFVALIKLYRKK